MSESKPRRARLMETVDTGSDEYCEWVCMLCGIRGGSIDDTQALANDLHLYFCPGFKGVRMKEPYCPRHTTHSRDVPARGGRVMVTMRQHSDSLWFLRKCSCP